MQNLEVSGTTAAALPSAPLGEAKPGTADPFFSGRKHYPALDGLRALAIIGVICLHFGGYLRHAEVARGGVLALALFKAFRHGAWGVDLFFMLSGYLITGILWQSRGQKHCFRNFYARRTLRIFPLYYGTLFALLVALPLVLGHVPAMLSAAYHRQLWLWTYKSNILIARRGLVLANFGHFWTLAVEEQFYLIWPLILLLIPPGRLLATTIIAILAVNLLRIIAFSASPHAAGSPIYEYHYNLTPFRADSLLAGALLAMLQFGGRLSQYRRVFAEIFTCTLPITLLFYLGASRGWK
jgi:peptidoglycan/LPS O-acetylase OafA/YrhL